MIECPGCKTENKPQAKFCRGCGTSLATVSGSGLALTVKEETCSSCGSPLSPGETICAKCGSVDASRELPSDEPLSVRPSEFLGDSPLQDDRPPTRETPAATQPAATSSEFSSQPLRPVQSVSKRTLMVAA